MQASHYDLMFTCDWLNNFATNAGSNAYLPLNDLLEENAPDAMADIPEYMWKATTINGNIYAMPALQTYAKNDGIFLRADIAEELGIEGAPMRMESIPIPWMIWITFTARLLKSIQA